MTSLKTLKAPNGLKEYNAKIIFTSIKYVFILLIIIFAGLKLFKRDAALNGDFKKSKFYGIYKVVEFKKNGNKASFSIEELKEIWKYFVMEYNGRVQIVDFNDDVTHYKSRIDSISNVIYLDAFNISKDSIRIHYRINENNGITFRLKNELDSLEIRCNILKEKDFLLMQRGFHLINEEAYYN